MNRYALIVPTYNSAHTIEATLKSILAVFDELTLLKKIVIADDGSKDATLEMVRKIWNGPIPLEIQAAPQNRGEYMNVNSAVISLANEVDWYLMMHSDNLVKPGWIKALVEQCEKSIPSIGSVCTSFDGLYLDGRLVPGESSGRITTFEGSAHCLHWALYLGCWWHNSTAAVRVSAFKEVGGMPAKQGLAQMGDWDFSLRLLSNGWGITYVERSLVVYVENATSVSSKNFLVHRDLIDRLEVTRRFCSGCPKEILNLILWKVTKILSQRLVSSLVKGQWKRLKAAIFLIPDVLKTYLYARKHSDTPLKPVRYPLQFEAVNTIQAF